MRLGAKVGAVVSTTALLALTACGSSSHSSGGTTLPSATGVNETAGITPTTITIGQLADVSGPVPGLFEGAVNGLAGWAAYVNSKGGIGGRKVMVDFKDSALNCSTFQTGIKSMAGNVAAVVGSMSVFDACGDPTVAAADYVYIPALASDQKLRNLPNVIAPQPQPVGASTAGYAWVKDKYGAAAVEHTGTLYSSTVASDQANLVSAAESLGYKYVYSRAVSPIESNFTSDILRMKSQGVQIVDITGIDVVIQTTFLKEAAQQNFHPLAVIGIGEYDANFFKLVSNPAYADNAVAPLLTAMYLGQDAGSVPEITTMTDWVDKVHPNATIDLYTLEAWSAGLLFQQALEKAGKSPTRSSILAAADKITSFNADGLEPNVNPAGKVPTNCAVIVGVRNGQFVRLDPSKGFACSLGKYFYASSSQTGTSGT